MNNFSTGAALLELCERYKLPISGVMLLRETTCLGAQENTARERMALAYDIMKRSVAGGLSGQAKPIGGLIGGEAQRLAAHAQSGKPVCGTLTARAVCHAMAVLEQSAAMGLIVAAPTAGSSGVIPGVFTALQEEYGLSDAQMAAGLWNAGAVGYLFMHNATVAGAEGGCQAEVGAASAMAASAAVELCGGTPAQCLDAAAIATGNLLGLVCDPVAGLVEYPCQNRNAVGASNALVCAEMALSGVRALIPFDEMVDAMFRVGQSLPYTLRETALGGCAATPTGCALCEKIYGKPLV